MANVQISNLDAANSVGLSDLFVLEQSGAAKKLTGQTLLSDLATELDGHGGISSIAKTGTSGLVDTYTITFADTTTSTFTVTNGRSISSIAKTGTSGLVDTYTITYSDGNTATFTVTNGSSISSIAKTGTSGLVDTYTITLTNGNTSTFTVTNGSAGADGDDAYIHFKWSAQSPTQDSDISDTPNNWLGVCANHSATAPTDYTQYTWTYARGADGAPGAQGIQGHSGAVPWRSTAAPTESSGTYSFDMTYVSRGAGIVGDVPAGGDILFYQDTYYSVLRVHVNAQTGITYVDCNNPYQFTGGGGGTSDYSDLTNKPSINGVTLSGNKTTAQLSLDQVWWATYGSTSLADIKTADAAGKIVMCKYTDGDGNEINMRLVDCTDDGLCYFSGLSKGLGEVFGAEVSMNGSSTVWDLSRTQYPPTAANVGAIPAPSSASSGQFLVYNGSAWVAQTVPSANGVSF